MRGRWIAAVIGAAVLIAAPEPARGEDFTLWKCKMQITFTGYSRVETLSDFPVMVVLGSHITNFSYSDFAPSGADLRFSAADETTELNYEIEKWDPAGDSYVWVQVPALANSNTCIYAYWGRSGIALPACTTNGATWSNGYVGVWHLYSDTGNHLLDSTSNRNNGVASGSPVSVAGKIGGGYEFGGASDYITIAASTSLTFSSSEVTIEGWGKLDVLSGERGMISASTPGDWGTFGMIYHGGALKYRVRMESPLRECFSTTAPAAGSWYYVTGMFSASAVRVCVAGAQETETTGSTVTSSKAFMIGAHGPNRWDGVLDEVRVSRIARTADWNWACWANQNTHSAFNTYGDVERVVGGMVLLLR